MTEDELTLGLQSLDNQYIYDLAGMRYKLNVMEVRRKLKEFELWLRASGCWKNEGVGELTKHFLNWLGKNVGMMTFKDVVYGNNGKQSIDDWEQSCIDRALSILASGGYAVEGANASSVPMQIQS